MDGDKGAGLASKAMRLAPPEVAHRLAIRALAAGLGPRFPTPSDGRLEIRLWDIEFPTPIGLAAGFDKNAEVVDAVLGLGAGFTEVGAITPRPQKGNPKPRVFRLPEDEAVINRLGFNNDGLPGAHERLRDRRAKGGIVGVNIGANKNSVDRMADYETVLRDLWGLCDFYTLNVSSPNTEKLRALQGKAALTELLGRIMGLRDGLASESGVNAPVLVKIAPDLTDAEIEAVAETAIGAGIDGIVATNTTLERAESLKSRHAGEKGGLSGAPLFARSTEVLKRLALRTERKLPLIGVGGVFTGADAYAKIRAGASLVQLYTAMIYRGPGVFHDVATTLAELLKRDGFASAAEAVGADL